MATLTVTLNDRTEADLNALSMSENTDAALLASRLLARAVRAARPRVPFDVERLKAYASENQAEELALADSDPEHRLALLEAEDNA